MKRKLVAKIGSLVAIAALMMTAGCSGGGSSSTTTTTTTTETTTPTATTALTVADKVSVVDAQSSGPSKLVALLARGITVGSTDSDYNKDKTFTYVHERSAEAFNTVNEILCMMAQTKYDSMMNKGAYKAMINTKLCSGNDSASKSGSSQQSGSSGTDAPEYETWTVKVERADDNSPQIIKVWVHEKARTEGTFSEPEKVIQAKITITESSSASNPYGLFTMNFVGYQASNGVPTSTTPKFKGILKAEKDPATGKVLLKFADKEGDGMFEEAASLEKNANGTGGGKVYSKESFGGQTKEATFNFAYNSSLFHRQNATEEVCLDRTNFETSAWRYGMYDAGSGSRVNVSSGFPINTKADGTGSHGWVGYWGLWVPNDVAIANDDTVYKQNFGPNAGAGSPYTVVKKNGKLKKHTKFTTTLNAIKKIPLEGYREDSTMYRVEWNGTALVKVASAAETMGGPPAWTEITPTPIDNTSLQFGELNFWSQALGGQARIKLANCQFVPATGRTSCDLPTGLTDVIYFTENIVYPGDTTAPGALRCYDNCPKALTTNGIDPDDMRYSQSFDPNVDNKHDYTVSDMVLMDGAYAALLKSVPDSQQWGFNSGPLFPPTTANLAKLACDWNTSQICGWKAWSALDEFYTWETGPNNWNQLTALKNPTTGEALKFEQPLRVEYIHVQTDVAKQDYKYNGTKFFLDYNGFGELHGIPGKCIDMNGEAKLDCSGQNMRWVPEFSIPEGSSGSYSKNGATFSTKIKPLEMEQRMVKLDNPSVSCAALPVGNYTLPVISNGTVEGWEDPALGTEPTVTAAPAVIAGVVQ